jgi:hypothetical protein
MLIYCERKILFVSWNIVEVVQKKKQDESRLCSLQTIVAL